jgi:hypothetical protein
MPKTWFAVPWTLAVPMLLNACGYHGAAVAPQDKAHRGAGTAVAGVPAQQAVDPDLVAGVSPGGADPPIGLKFRLDTKPAVGQPAQLVLALIPTPGIAINHIHGSLQASDGLQLQSPRIFDIDSPQGSATLRQDVTVVPTRNGVLSLSATVVVDYEDGSTARTYVIPLIAVASAS